MLYTDAHLPFLGIFFLVKWEQQLNSLPRAPRPGYLKLSHNDIWIIPRVSVKIKRANTKYKSKWKFMPSLCMLTLYLSEVFKETETAELASLTSAGNEHGLEKPGVDVDSSIVKARLASQFLLFQATSILSLKAFNWEHEAHLHCREQSICIPENILI